MLAQMFLEAKSKVELVDYRALIQNWRPPEGNQIILISMFSVVGFNIIIFCQSRSNQIEIILTGLNLTTTGSHWSSA